MVPSSGVLDKKDPAVAVAAGDHLPGEVQPPGPEAPPALRGADPDGHPRRAGRAADGRIWGGPGGALPYCVISWVPTPLRMLLCIAVLLVCLRCDVQKDYPWDRGTNKHFSRRGDGSGHSREVCHQEPFQLACHVGFVQEEGGPVHPFRLGVGVWETPKTQTFCTEESQVLDIGPFSRKKRAKNAILRLLKVQSPKNYPVLCAVFFLYR